MAKHLMIVESPAKAKTIEKFLDNKFIVKSSYGHIRDLAKGLKAIDIENKFSPTYEVSKDKQALVKELKQAAKECESVWLATDEDREGEAISWHLCEVLGLPVNDVKRIVFHEITKDAITKAVEEPRNLDINLVNAQQARRILDRLVGFELSPVLWKKASLSTTLSAGRVQSVAVKLIVEREREIQDFVAISTYRIKGKFHSTSGEKFNIEAELNDRLENIEEARTFLNNSKDANYAVESVNVKPGKKSPSAPFTTSTLQQQASTKLGYSVTKTMLIAQKLYEAGLITYMRTDSVNLSETAINSAKEVITKQYGAKFSNPRKYKTKNAGAQEAHEAIRPTYFDRPEIDGESDEQRLYALIWKRAISSQMSDAELERTTINIATDKYTQKFQAKGEIILFEGFLKVYLEFMDTEDNEEKILPPISVGQTMNADHINATERFTRPHGRFTEATLVKKMEELGIGRPSTYAPTITTVQKRGYVLRESRDGKEREFHILSLNGKELTEVVELESYENEKNKLFPTDVGFMVTDFLSEHFKNVMDYNFTAQIEKEFDEIASGLKQWSNMIDGFYQPFHKSVEDSENAERKTMERELGIDPKTGKTVFCRMGKYGPMVQLGQLSEEEDAEKPKYAKLLSTQSLETITFEEALDLFKLPRVVGELEGMEIKASIGRFGPYVQYNSKFYSLGKEGNAFEVSFDEAVKIIKEKDEKDAAMTIKLFDSNPDLKILDGRYGPYVKLKRKNVSVPKDVDPTTLTEEQAMDLINNPPIKKKKKAAKKKSSKK